MKFLYMAAAFAVAVLQPTEALLGASKSAAKGTHQNFKDPVTGFHKNKDKEYEQHTHELACDACHIVASKIMDKLEEVSPEELVKMGRKGGERVDMKYARSELHLTDTLEAFCKHIPEYWAVAQEDVDGKWIYLDEENHIAHESDLHWSRYKRDQKVMEKVGLIQKEMDERNRKRREGIPFDELASFEADAIDTSHPEQFSYHNKEYLEDYQRKAVRYACRKIIEKSEDKLVDYLKYNWAKDLRQKLPEVMCTKFIDLCNDHPEKIARKVKEEL